METPRKSDRTGVTSVSSALGGEQVLGDTVDKFGGLSESWYAGSPHLIEAIGWPSGLVEQELCTCCFGVLSPTPKVDWRFKLSLYGT